MAEARDYLLNGVRYHAVRHGNPTKSSLLLLHGFTGSGANWSEHVSVFSKQYSVLSVDVLGHGRSACPPNPNRYAMPLVATDIIALLDAWQIVQTAVLGYSMGGRLALYLACNYRERFSHLILESSSPGLATEPERAARRQSDEALADWIEVKGIEAFVKRWEALPLWASQAQLPDGVRQRLRQQRLQNSPVGLANSLRGMGTGAQPSLWPCLPTLTLPTLLIAGELDAKFISINQQMAAQLPDGRLHVIPHAGHTTHLERPSAFATAVTHFLG
ncbi:2-succinyl-6-hydroxy-2,4-cyclohexadiene-1-carboxylate synthase [Candidatus Leptofilum sp.]|uniref:2-succinyl-6-hydroxy-2, 4-cyclohexadiene-1-carboxylate synthase n=1 Tax=Candidatus Leptofilum sp. TaxID=3241576 RepID=UPI003B59E77D